MKYDDETMWELTWIAAPRPPVHTKEMTGRQSFSTFDEAIKFFEKRPKDSRFVRIVEITTMRVDQTHKALNAISSGGNGSTMTALQPQKKTLKQFYHEVQQWIDDGFPKHDVFRNDRPLPALLVGWCNADEVYKMTQELNISFQDEKLDMIYPFNDRFWAGLNDEMKNKTVYQNRDRLQWIKDRSI